jgi:hypothetical protein
VLRRLVTTVATEGKGVVLTAEFHYSVHGLASRYDHVVIGLFELADGEFGTWLAGRPDDAPKKVGTVLDASSNTVRALP